MSQSNKTSLSIQVTDINLGESGVAKEDVTYYVSLNSKLLNIQPINDSSNKVEFPISDKKEYIQIIFKSISKNQVLGSVSITTDYFINLNRGSYSNWITLFDDPEDDIFDGDIGVNDEEIPKALFSFNIIGGQPSTNISPVKGQKDPKAHTKEYITQNKKQTPQAPQKETNIQNTSLENHQNPTRRESQFQEIQVIDYADPQTLIERLNELLGLLKDIIAKSPDDALQQLNLVQNVKEEFIAKYIKKYYGTKKVGPQNIRVLEGELAKLKLELETKGNLEDQIELLKQQREKHDDLYTELILKYENQLTRYDKDNQQLKDQIQELQQKINEQDHRVLAAEKSLQDTRQEYETKLKQQIELDNLRIEKSRQKNSLLQGVLNDLQKQSIDQADLLQKEKQRREQLITDYDKAQQKLHEQNELIDKLRQDAAQRDIDNQQQIDEVNKENNKLKENEIVNEAEISRLKKENDLLRKDLERSKDDFRQLQIQNNQLEYQVEDAKKSRENELKKLREQYSEARLKNANLEKQNSTLQKQLEGANLEKEQTQAKNFHDLVLDIENKYLSSENSRNALQQQCEQADQNWSEVLEYYNKPDYQSLTQDLEESRQRSETLLSELRKRNDKISELNRSIGDLKVQVAILTERRVMSENLHAEIRELRNEIHKLEQNRNEQQDYLYRMTEEFIQQTNVSIEQHILIHNLAYETNRLEKEVQILLEGSKKRPQVSIEEVDKKLDDFLDNNPQPIKFVKLSEGVYKFGSRQLFVRILHGKLVIRVGGGYLLIEEFLKLYANQEITKMRQAGLDPTNTSNILQMPTDISDNNESRSPSPDRKSEKKGIDSPTNEKQSFSKIGFKSQENIANKDESKDNIEEEEEGIVVEISPDSKKKDFANYFRRMSRFDKPVQSKTFEKVRIQANQISNKSSKSPISKTATIVNNKNKFVSPKDYVSRGKYEDKN